MSLLHWMRVQWTPGLLNDSWLVSGWNPVCPKNEFLAGGKLLNFTSTYNGWNYCSQNCGGFYHEGPLSLLPQGTSSEFMSDFCYKRSKIITGSSNQSISRKT